MRKGYGHRCLPCERRRSRAYQRRRKTNDPAATMWTVAKRRAKQQGVEFTITKDDVRRVWPPDGRCPVLGLRMMAGKGVQQDASPSLDRLNSEWGYTPGNIAVISLRANRAKAGCTAAEHERIAAWMRGQGLA